MKIRSFKKIIAAAAIVLLIGCSGSSQIQGVHVPNIRWAGLSFSAAIWAPLYDANGVFLNGKCGSGFLFNKKEKLILTARHVASLTQEGRVLKLVHNGKKYPLSYIWSHPIQDVAILKINSSDDVGLEQINITRDIPRIGSHVAVVGFQWGNGSFCQSVAPVVITEASKYAIKGVVPNQVRLNEYAGLSGSALVIGATPYNNTMVGCPGNVEAVGVFWGGFLSWHSLRFAPIASVPKEYWPDE